MHTFDNTLRAPCSAVTSLMFLPTKYCSVRVILKIMNKRRGGERERGREGEGERGRGESTSLQGADSTIDDDGLRSEVRVGIQDTLNLEISR